jgi:hypothetical protein
LRRVTFDLTGLPPTPEEIAAFENDRAPKAFETVVDRLLGVAGVRRALGPALARRRALRRIERHRTRTSRIRSVALSRLGHRGVSTRTSRTTQMLREQLAGDFSPARATTSARRTDRDRLPGAGREGPQHARRAAVLARRRGRADRRTVSQGMLG